MNIKTFVKEIVIDIAGGLLIGFGIYNFGPRALWHVLITVAACVLTELGFEFLVKKPITIGDFSAVVTGLLLALNLPVSAPLWIGA